MHRYHVIIFSVIFLIGSAKAQNIAGKIVNQKGNPVDFATISLKNADSTLLTGTLSDEEGSFEFRKLNEGSYLLMVSAIGYKYYVSKLIMVTPTGTTSTDIRLEEDSKMLGEIQVQGKKQMIQQEAGKTVVNVENSIVSQGLMAIELLKRTPGVVVDNDGNISLKGKENVLLMIDGKPTYLSAKQAAAILKSLPSNQIANIEVMTTPPAKYDAQGNAGIININLKKGSMSGLSGSVHASLGHGRLPKSNIGASLTAGVGKWSLNGVYDFTANEDFTEYNQTRGFGGKNSGQKYVLRQKYTVPFYSNTYRVSADFQASSKLSFSASHRGILSSDVYYGNNLTGTVFNPDGSKAQQLTTNDHNPDRYYSFTGGLGGKYIIDTAGHEFSADIDVSTYNQRSSQTTNSRLSFGNDILPANVASWDGQLPTSVNIYTSKIDYTKPFTKTLKFEAGLKRIDIDIDSDIKFVSSQSGNLVLKLPNSNHFTYKENISAAYASINYKKGDWSGIVGLRTEWWQAEGHQKTTNEKFTRDSVVPFPTATLKYKLLGSHELTVNYNRRIDRPNYRNLNPITYYTDPYTAFAGNPRLRPQLTHNLEFSHSFLEGGVVTTLNYSESSNKIQEYVLVPNADTSKQQVMTTINIPKFTNLGASISIYIPVNKIWTTQLFVNGFQNKYSGSLFGAELNNIQWSYMINTTQMFSLPKTWSIEASGTYLSPVLEGYSVVRSMGMLALGVQKDVFDSRGTVKLAAQDVFYTFIYKIDTQFEGINSYATYQWDNRVVTMSFVWKFGRNRFESGEKEEETKTKTGGRM